MEIILLSDGLRHYAKVGTDLNHHASFLAKLCEPAIIELSMDQWVFLQGQILLAATDANPDQINKKALGQLVPVVASFHYLNNKCGTGTRPT
ncbi:MAG: hypothetical protein A3H57_03235 [Candidatus Taylorbacteria bacterium RIFCSPLOWO2_02_FULL_43_11]|uniref:Uncharacterized protein n=1 Tax=Candidatus Taylorbacteria bacterium RIFCSPHIGHO2_02_FULL_43_32b TaxID=1802306 RepID=A0A1G2MFI7_9BACT|nr:MAG: hypothetical protein A2743_00845 [Candidatus Taylorbacteria bacterium RIFCSPHIGHO2_01_FULL_43_47]OHA22670.1 MAG: hypothetical protein A3C72_01270 [Candidatus Taylorbacteria bacterium RIFCSPHIGHO2_02_FULL_43_32b]OHA29630.1 MAG: hypothetical protein A3B08_03375 [Candidatus Taylorbacteria bacterium RIFCSPLOWO2_01_FULL_43_44]OHA36119.1 MAG: hypothetical protein A3H57_03235 [Candidatus Taylorbacteria bacterium RIFCSPLOWO2_02_FULL_43_11]